MAHPRPLTIAMSHKPSAMITRRDFLSTALFAPASLLAQGAATRHLGNIALGDAAGFTAGRLNRLIGTGLSARLSTDLSKVTAADAIATDKFFVRTAAPQKLPAKIAPDSWAIDIGGVAESLPRVTAASLETLRPRTGRYLLECLGNSDPSA